MKSLKIKILFCIIISFFVRNSLSVELEANKIYNANLTNLQETETISIGEALCIAAKNNPFITLASERISMARADKLTAISYYFPRGRFGGRYTHLGKQTIAEDVEFNTSEFSGALRDLVNGYNQAAGGLHSLAKSLIDSGLFPPGSDIEKSLKKLKKARAINVNVPDSIITDITLKEQDIFVSSLRVIQPLFLGGRVYYRHQQAKVGENMAANRLRQAKIAVAHDTLVTYFLYNHAIVLHSILKDSEERIKAIEGLAKKRMEKANPANKSDATAPTEYWRAKVFRLMMADKSKEAEAGIKNSLTALCALIGRSPYNQCKFKEIDFSSFDKLEKIVSNASAKRPLNDVDVKYMELAVEALKKGRKATASGFWPQIYGFFQYDTPNNFNYTEQNKGNWQIGVGFDIPIFALFENISKYQKANAEVAAARAGLAGTILKTEVQVCRYINDIKSLNERLEILKEAEEAKIKRLKTSRQLYYLGLNDLKDVLDAQYESVQVDIQLAVLNYEKACSLINLAEFFPDSFEKLANTIKRQCP